MDVTVNPIDPVMQNPVDEGSCVPAPDRAERKQVQALAQTGILNIDADAPCSQETFLSATTGFHVYLKPSCASSSSWWGEGGRGLQTTWLKQNPRWLGPWERGSPLLCTWGAARPRPPGAPSPPEARPLSVSFAVVGQRRQFANCHLPGQQQTCCWWPSPLGIDCDL